MDSRTNNNTVKAYYITYSPNYEANSNLTKADVEKNEQDSIAKKQLDLWYQNKFSPNLNNGKAVTTYLADNSFCNDRSINATYTNGSYTLSNRYTTGYLLTDYTYYQARRRLVDAVDPNKNDNFSVTETNNTNGKLDYPIGLITADEVAFAGGKFNEKNEKFWLRTNEYFWTMTPLGFGMTNVYARGLGIGPTGFMYDYSVASGFGMRAVINLNSDVLIASGDGTVEHPFVID